MPHRQSKKVRILTVLEENTVGLSSPKIDIQFDQQELEKLRNQGAEIVVLKQPSPEKLREYLWQEEGWHIFFFAGHSSSDEDGKVGEIILNYKEKSLKITELQEALKKAISCGLQLAIFNSCDGLGLANQLAELNIRQMIVMREPVPDTVAKAFLQHFLTTFACRNQSFYAAVREARLRLEDWEKRFPGAKWLPVIYQNPTVIPPTWKHLRTRGSIKAVEQSVNSPFTHQLRLSFWKFLIGLIGLGTVTVVFIVVFPFYIRNYPQPQTSSKSSPSSKPTESTSLNLPSPMPTVPFPESEPKLRSPQVAASASPTLTVQVPVSISNSPSLVPTIEPLVSIIPSPIRNPTFVPSSIPTPAANSTQSSKDSVGIESAKYKLNKAYEERDKAWNNLQSAEEELAAVDSKWTDQSPEVMYSLEKTGAARELLKNAEERVKQAEAELKKLAN